MEKPEITQTDLDNLADIIWWIKGYRAGARDQMEECPFVIDHEESLRKCRVALASIVRKEGNLKKRVLNGTMQN